VSIGKDANKVIASRQIIADASGLHVGDTIEKAKPPQ
jgi:hypothetical protein